MRHIETLRLDPNILSAGLADLETYIVEDIPYLLASTFSGGGLFSYALGVADGAMSATDTAFYGAGSVGIHPNIQVLDIDGQALVLPLGAMAGTPIGYMLDPHGALEREGPVQGLETHSVVGLDHLSVGGQTWYFTSEQNSETLRTYQLSETSRFTQVASLTGPTLTKVPPLPRRLIQSQSMTLGFWWAPPRPTTVS